jgi:DNA-binding HxlR family transcriptional regulator
MKRSDSKSYCPINYALEVMGDPWSLLVVRDIVFYGKHTYGEFMASGERITTSVLADRLASLIKKGILEKRPLLDDKRKATYALTAKGLDLIPLLVEMANWGVIYDARVIPKEKWVTQVKADRNRLIELIRSTVLEGGSVFYGDNNVMAKL